MDPWVLHELVIGDVVARENAKRDAEHQRRRDRLWTRVGVVATSVIALAAVATLVLTHVL